jgi:hypothetical protein
MGRAYPGPSLGDPRATLETWLDWLRAGVVAKARGLSDPDGALAPVDSGTSLTGVVRHLCTAEQWFAAALDATSTLEEADFHEAWRVAPSTSLDEALARYEAACDASRVVQRRVSSLEDQPAMDDLKGHDYCWVLTMMLEETSRHLGHLDILRELRDGTTGE